MKYIIARVLFYLGILLINLSIYLQSDLISATMFLGIVMLIAGVFELVVSIIGE